MCGFYSRDDISRDDFKNFYDVDSVDSELLDPRYNIRPKTYNVVITKNSPNKAKSMLWWFHPGWPGFPENRGVINARLESIKEGKSFFKSAFSAHRCLIPVSHWVEWKEISGTKIPHLFSIKNRKFFAFAGLWNEYTNAKGEKVKGYAIITTTPNPVAAKIHNRQPCVLMKKDEKIWLDPKEKDIVTQLKCLETYPADDMDVYAVRRDLSENSPDILKSLSENELADEIKGGQASPKKFKAPRAKSPRNVNCSFKF